MLSRICAVYVSEEEIVQVTRCHSGRTLIAENPPETTLDANTMKNFASGLDCCITGRK